MRKYARIQNNVYVETFETDGDITTMFHPSLIWIDITDMKPQPQELWTYIGGTFAPPPIYVPTPEEIRAANVGQRDYLLSVAALAIGPLQDAVDLDEATPEETAALLTWKKFRVAVNRVNLTIYNVAWPDFPPQHYAAQPESDV